jgi:hypothetical protein
MTMQKINLGNIVNDGLGDDLRTAFQKVNANFTELQSSLTVTASNIDSIGASVFKQKTGTNLEFRKIASGSKITVTEESDKILISSTVPDAFVRITTDQNFIDADSNQFINIRRGRSPARFDASNIQVVAVNSNTIEIDTVLPLNDILKVVDFGYVKTAFDTLVQFNTAMANVDLGTIDNPSNINLDLGTFSGV